MRLCSGFEAGEKVWLSLSSSFCKGTDSARRSFVFDVHFKQAHQQGKGVQGDQTWQSVWIQSTQNALRDDYDTYLLLWTKPALRRSPFFAGDGLAALLGHGEQATAPDFAKPMLCKRMSRCACDSDQRPLPFNEVYHEPPSWIGVEVSCACPTPSSKQLEAKPSSQRLPRSETTAYRSLIVP
eukprot:2906697-Amphidinium_carterae.1